MQHMKLFYGSIDRTTVHARVILQKALACTAAAVILRRSHPGGCAEPSPSDMGLTRRVKELLEEVDVQLLDHIVVFRSESVSMAARGLALPQRSPCGRSIRPGRGAGLRNPLSGRRSTARFGVPGRRAPYPRRPAKSPPASAPPRGVQRQQRARRQGRSRHLRGLVSRARSRRPARRSKDPGSLRRRHGRLARAGHRAPLRFQHRLRAPRHGRTFRNAVVKRALQRMHRRKGRRQEQDGALTWPLRERLLAATGSRLIDVRNRTLLAVAYDTLLRRSELAALQVADLVMEVDGSATVLVRRGVRRRGHCGAGARVARTRQHRPRAGIPLPVPGRARCRARPEPDPAHLQGHGRAGGLPPDVVDGLPGHSTGSAPRSWPDCSGATGMDGLGMAASVGRAREALMGGAGKGAGSE